MDQEAGEQKLADYLKPLSDCIDAISNRDIKLRDCIKATATVATQVAIQGKLTTGLKELYETTKKRTKDYLKQNPTATIKQYVITADGRILQAAGGPGKNTVSMKEMGRKGVRNSSSTSNNSPIKIGDKATTNSSGKTVLKITTKDATEAAKKLGYKKTNYYSSGQPVFQKGNKFITIDIDVLNGGFWKMADSVRNLGHRNTRMGTYDKFLNRIGE